MILNIYKPKNWTSFDVVAKVRGVLRVKKAGHAGTLDPLADGVLIVLTEKDTKRQNDFMKMEKEYVAEIAFGAESPTFDLEITPKLILRHSPELVYEMVYERLEKIIPDFTGEIEQLVPPYSAKKIEGKEMYKLARKGIEVPEERKKVIVHSIKIIEKGIRAIETDQGPVELPCPTFKIKCSSGTYVRSLAYEMGRRIETGGVLVSLTRTAVGKYKIGESIRIEDLSSPRSL